MTTPIVDTAARSVQCPQCGARPGESCVAPNGTKGRTHKARKQ